MRVSLLQPAIALALAFLLFQDAASPAEVADLDDGAGWAKLQFSRQSNGVAIPGLTWRTSKVPIQCTLIDGKYRLYVEIPGTFKGPENSSLQAFSKKNIEVSAAGEFMVRSYLEWFQQGVTITAFLGPHQTVSESIWIDGALDNTKPLNCRTGPPPRLNASAGIATTYLNYSEKLGDLRVREDAITGKVGLSYRLIEDWLGLAGNMFGTLFSIAHTPSTLPAARFIGVNGRLLFHLPFSPLDWRPSIGVGAYFWSMYVPNDAYGVQGLIGPQLLLSARRRKAEARAATLYLKYAMVGSSLGGLSPGSREIAGGFGYQVNSHRSKHAVMATFDLSQLRLGIEEAGNELNLLSASLRDLTGQPMRRARHEYARNPPKFDLA